jgi:hypothetical protein
VNASVKEGEDPVLTLSVQFVRFSVSESCSLGVERKLGGSFHPRLNTGEKPIAKKYHEGKMKRPSKGGSKLPETVEREAIDDLVVSVSLVSRAVWSVRKSDLSVFGSSTTRKLAGSRSVTERLVWLSFLYQLSVSVLILARNAAIAKVFKRPVLKHGPRSLTYVQVIRWQTLRRNESDSLDVFCTNDRPFLTVRV